MKLEGHVEEEPLMWVTDLDSFDGSSHLRMHGNRVVGERVGLDAFEARAFNVGEVLSVGGVMHQFAAEQMKRRRATKRPRLSVEQSLPDHFSSVSNVGDSQQSSTSTSEATTDLAIKREVI